MDEAVRVDGALGRHQCLADDLAAEDPLPADLRAQAAEQVFLQLLEIENGEQRIHGRGGLGGARHFGCLRW
ncbi:hypothetical protein D9M70_528130 [compost metagenome]